MAELPASFELHLEPDTELAQADTQATDVELIRNCKIWTGISQARYGHFNGKGACLFVFESKFLPYYDVRFKYVEVELRIVKARGHPSSSIIAYQPKAWQGRGTTSSVQSTSNVSFNTGIAPAAVSGLNAGVQVGFSRQVGHDEVKTAWLDSSLEQTVVTWLLCENGLSKQGAPNPFKGAVLISAADNLSIRLKYCAKLSKSADPRSWWPSYARTVDPIPLNQRALGNGVGPTVDHIDEMEKEEFQLEDFVNTSWNL